MIENNNALFLKNNIELPMTNLIVAVQKTNMNKER
jgi:hypothetical protein